MDINSIPCPWEFTGNAHEEFNALFKAAYQWVVWARDFYTEDGWVQPPDFQLTGFPDEGCQGGKPEFARNEPMPAGHVADGITLWCYGWQAEAYGEFVEHVLHKVPGIYPYPDGDININITPGADHILLHLWHD